MTQMENFKRLMVAVTMCLLPVSAVAAGSFDGSVPLLCASITAIECGTNGKCEAGSAESINAPQFFRLDFGANKVRGKRPDGSALDAPIKGVTRDGGQLIFQGVENGRAWSATIAEDTGKMVVSASGDEVAFILFGACTPLP